MTRAFCRYNDPGCPGCWEQNPPAIQRSDKEDFMPRFHIGVAELWDLAVGWWKRGRLRTIWYSGMGLSDRIMASAEHLSEVVGRER